VHRQPDLFSPALARQFHRQAELFDQAAATDADSDIACSACGAFLVRTVSGFLCCPRGHGKLLTEAVPDPEAVEAETDDVEPWPVEALAIAKQHAKRDRWLWGRSRCICGACRFTRGRSH
jgi:hypothetical protein